jgi:hypothetical protein
MNWGDYWSGFVGALSLVIIAACVVAVLDEARQEPDWEDEHERWCDCLCPRCGPVEETATMGDDRG